MSPMDEIIQIWHFGFVQYQFLLHSKVILHEVLALSALSFLRVQLILHESKVPYSLYHMPTANSRLLQGSNNISGFQFSKFASP